MSSSLHDYPDAPPTIYLCRRIVQSRLFIDSRFAERIDVRRIADEACFSKFHFIRLFRRFYGKTPHRYLAEVRIEKAKELLSDGMSVTQACFSVGFDSPGSFTALFKRLTGRTPSGFRSARLALRRDQGEVPLRHIPGCFAGRAASV